MPLKTYATKADFDADYEYRDPSGVVLHYNRFRMVEISRTRALCLQSVLGLSPPGPSMVIVGAGFSWTAEAMEELGYTRVVGIDVGAYVQGNKAVSESAEIDAAITAAGYDPLVGQGAALRAKFHDGGGRVRATRGVLNESGNTGSSRNAIKAAVGVANNQSVDWAVSENLFEALDDAECVQASTTAHQYATSVAHIVSPLESGGSNRDPVLNFKTMDQWKTLIPGDTFLWAFPGGCVSR